MAGLPVSELAPGAVVEVRGLRWVVTDVDSGQRPGFGLPDSGQEPDRSVGGQAKSVVSSATLVELQSIEDDRFNEALSVIWEVEPGARVLPTSSLPDPNDGFDRPQRLAAFLDAVRWGAVTSADVNALQAPFRSGVQIEDYQLEPVARSLTAPRVNLLLADDVGLGKTIEAGLVVLELLLRHRARKVMVICPAGLTVKWRQEMSEKFGREFVIINSEQCALLRRTHGSAANPFRVYPLTIVSLPWLRTPRGQRLLDEVLPPEGPMDQREFDVLILDEAHHVAPAAPKQRYAVDSQQTKLIRRLAPHFEHRLFLTATPHNGYPESFEALLELVDDQRFARGVEPDPQAQREVMIRRLKADILEPDGSRRFRERRTTAIAVNYPEDEREGHALLKQYAARRAERLRTNRSGRRAADLVTLLLKKRLFSSPAAFAQTLSVYIENQQAAGRIASADRKEPDWLDDFWGQLADLDDEHQADEEDLAVRRATVLEGGTTTEELDLLERMRRWAAQHSPNPDAKAQELIDFLKAVCKPDVDWTNERVVVFTEYRDTQDWLVRQLQQQGLGDRVEILHGGMNAQERERLRQAFQADPSEARVRILVATDAASEGIDLHWRCHRLVNYDIPFNPNKLEQRIGRIDRYGQSYDPEVFHFVGAGFGRAVDSFEADLEFLSRVARKVAQMEADLGAVNAVLAAAVQRRMLGQQVDLDVELATQVESQPRKRLPSDSNIREQVRRLHEQLETSVRALNINPDSLKRVVDTALELSHQQPLVEVMEPGELWDVPALTGTWESTVQDLPHPLHPDERRPITFEPAVANRMREDVVYAHLGHRLVARATRMLRAAVTSTDIDLHRVAAVISDDPELQDVLAVSYARFVVVGGDGVRLHEEILHAGGWVRPAGRFARVESFARLDTLLTAALAAGHEAPPNWRTRLAHGWTNTENGLFLALQRRAEDRSSTLRALFQRRENDERTRLTENLRRFENSLTRQLAEQGDGEQPTLFGMELTDPTEAAQLRRDRDSWRQRLVSLPTELDQELTRISARYATPADHLFPVAVVFVLPRRLAVR